MSSVNVVTITDSNFEQEVLKASTPVLVDFWAEWCGPCKMLAPVLDELADETVGKLKVAKANVDQCTVAGSFQVRSIPTLLFFKNGEVKDQVVGIKSKAELLAKFQALA
jgi:thioredoxin 1